MTTFAILCLGLDTLLRTQGLQAQGIVNEATAFLNATVQQAPDPEPAAEPQPEAKLPRAERRRAKPKKNR